MERPHISEKMRHISLAVLCALLTLIPAQTSAQDSTGHAGTLTLSSDTSFDLALGEQTPSFPALSGIAYDPATAKISVGRNVKFMATTTPGVVLSPYESLDPKTLNYAHSISSPQNMPGNPFVGDIFAFKLLGANVYVKTRVVERETSSIRLEYHYASPGPFGPYPAPDATMPIPFSVEPSAVSQGTPTLTIQGTGFQEGVEIFFELGENNNDRGISIQPPGISVNEAGTEITVPIAVEGDPRFGSWYKDDIKIVNPGGLSYTLSGALEIGSNSSGGQPPPPTTSNPDILLSVASLSFGEVEIGQSSSQSLTISNTGNAPLSVTGVSVSEGSFAVSPTATTISAGSSQSLNVTFSPQSAGSQQATLTLASNDPDEASLTVSLSGEGTPPPAPDIAVSPTTLDFGQLTEGQSASRVLTVSNAGTAPLSVTNIVPGDLQYTVSSETFTLSPGSSRDGTVTFTPLAGRTPASTLTIVSNDPDTPVLIADLVATVGGVEGDPRISVFPASLNFGTVTLGQSKNLTLLVSNQGGSNLHALNIVTSNPGFTLSEVGFLLAPGQEKMLTVTFQPSRVGSVAETLDIPSDDPEKPTLQISLRATVSSGVGAPAIAVELLTLDFGQVEIGKTARLTLPVRNDGSAPLTISNAVSDNTQVIVSPSSLNVPPQESRALNISFRPLPGRERQGALTLFSNDQLQPQVALSWSASDVSSPFLELVSLSPADGDFAIETDTRIEMRFSQPLFHRRHFTAIDVELTPQPISGPIANALEVRGDGSTVLFPVQLADDTTYRLVVYGATGRAGLELFDMVEATFSTGGAPPVLSSISGQIIVSETEGLSGSIFLFGKGRQLVAQGNIALDGSYLLSDVPAGEYTVYANAELSDGSTASSPYDPDGDGTPNVVTMAGDDLTGIDISPVPRQISETTQPAADDQILLDLDSASGNQNQTTLTGVAPEQEIVLEVYTAAVEQLTGCAIDVKFDTTQVFFSRVEEGDNILHQSEAVSLFLQNIDPEEGVISFGGSLMGASAETAVDGSGLLGRFYFTVLEGFSGETALTVSQVKLPTLAEKVTLQPNAQVTLAESGSTEPPASDESPITIDFDMADGDQQQRTAGGAAPGKTYDLQLNVAGAPEIKGWSAIIEYDPQQVQYTSNSFEASDFLPGLIALTDAKESTVSVGGTILGTETSNSGMATLGTLSFEILEGFTGSTELIITEIKYNWAAGGQEIISVHSVATLTSESVGSSLTGDFDSNGTVDFSDFFLFADAFGSDNPLCDLSGDGTVNFSDFFIFADNFGAQERAKLIALAHEYLGLPNALRLEQNYPNPFNSGTTIRFSLPTDSRIELSVYDLAGQKIATLADGSHRAGSHSVQWRPTAKTSGVYFYRLRTDTYIETRKMTLLK
jgi:hypothetical protein